MAPFTGAGWTGFGGGSVRAGRRRARHPDRRSRAGPCGQNVGLVRARSLVHDWVRDRGRGDDHDRAHDQVHDPQSGSAAAEFAVALPAVVLVLACCLGAVQVASQQVRLADAAADAARTLARGDPVSVAASRVQMAMPSAVMTTSVEGDFVCALLSAPAVFGPAGFAGVRVSASSCALDGGL